jgi:hypothetical protein
MRYVSLFFIAVLVAMTVLSVVFYPVIHAIGGLAWGAVQQGGRGGEALCLLLFLGLPLILAISVFISISYFCKRQYVRSIGYGLGFFVAFYIVMTFMFFLAQQ